MMWEWVGSRPRRCLKVGTDAIAWAEMERSWRGQRRYICATTALSIGMVKPSPTDDNLSDPSAVANRIRTLVSSGFGPRRTSGSMLPEFPQRIAVMLPDTAVRAAVLHLEQLPDRREERDALIRWRLGQEQLFPLNGAKVVSQVFHNQKDEKQRAYTVLTVAVQESVLRQYESLCESIGLVSHDVGITSLWLFDLWRKLCRGYDWRRQPLMWVTVADRALTTMVYERGRPLFYRCKLLGTEVDEVCAKTEILNRIIGECGASLEVCRQHYPSVSIQNAVVCADGDCAVLQELMEGELQLSVDQFGWTSVEALGWLADGSQRGMASFAALAGVSA